jgi:hypothetical protein
MEMCNRMSAGKTTVGSSKSDLERFNREREGDTALCELDVILLVREDRIIAGDRDRVNVD